MSYTSLINLFLLLHMLTYQSSTWHLSDSATLSSLYSTAKVPTLPLKRDAMQLSST